MRAAEDVDLAAIAHIPDADGRVAAGGREDVRKARVRRDRVDRCAVSVKVVYLFVAFEVPVADQLVFTARK